MDSTTIFVAVVVFIVINIIGIAVTLAVVLYQLNLLISGGALVVPPDTGPVDVMEQLAWKKQRDDTLASKARLSSAYRTGVMVLLWLAFLTAIEFVAASADTTVLAQTPLLAAAGIHDSPDLGDGILLASNDDLQIDVTANATISGMIWGVEEGAGY